MSVHAVASHIAVLGSTHIAQILKKQVRFVFGNAIDATGEDFVDKDALPASDRCFYSVSSKPCMGKPHLRLVRIMGCVASKAGP